MENEPSEKLPKFIGRMLCFFGFHDFKIIDATLGFGFAGGTSNVECRRCGRIVTLSN